MEAGHLGHTGCAVVRGLDEDQPLRFPGEIDRQLHLIGKREVNVGLRCEADNHHVARKMTLRLPKARPPRLSLRRLGSANLRHEFDLVGIERERHPHKFGSRNAKSLSFAIQLFDH